MRLILYGFLVAFLAVAASPLAAGELVIKKVRAPVLMLWGDTEGSQLIKEIAPANVPPDLAVDDVSDNLMLHVTIDDKTSGWVFGHHVETNSDVKLTAECDPSVATEEVGAVRGLGKGCD